MGLGFRVYGVMDSELVFRDAGLRAKIPACKVFHGFNIRILRLQVLCAFLVTGIGLKPNL